MSSLSVLVLKEDRPSESRVALVPMHVKGLLDKGLEVSVVSGCGEASQFSDSDYEAAGARVVSASSEELSKADVVIGIHPPDEDRLNVLKKGTALVCLLDPFRTASWPQELASMGLSALSLEMIPRSTIAQKMDVISSQANLAGYVAVLEASRHLGRILPLMMTPAGTLAAAKVFVLGAGVAGLQAIATARRLGARVEAFDTRAVVAEQVESLGAKFFKIDLGETGQTKDGYASALSPEQLELQRKALLKALKKSDIIITTAKLFGRPSPILINREMLKELSSGTVVVDLAAGSGGNVEGTIRGEVTQTAESVTLVGLDPLECQVANHASLMFSANISHFFDHCLESGGDGKAEGWKWEDPVVKSCLICHGGAVVHPQWNSEATDPN